MARDCPALSEVDTHCRFLLTFPISLIRVSESSPGPGPVGDNLKRFHSCTERSRSQVDPRWAALKTCVMHMGCVCSPEGIRAVTVLVPSKADPQSYLLHPHWQTKDGMATCLPPPLLLTLLLRLSPCSHPTLHNTASFLTPTLGPTVLAGPQATGHGRCVSAAPLHA